DEPRTELHAEGQPAKEEEDEEQRRRAGVAEEDGQEAGLEEERLPPERVELLADVDDREVEEPEREPREHWILRRCRIHPRRYRLSAQDPTQCRARGVPPAEPVHAGAGWGGGGADEDGGVRGAVRVRPPGGSREELADVGPAAGDVAAYVVRVVALEIGGAARRDGEDAVAEAWCKALDLGQDAIGHVHGRTVRHVAVRPHGVSSFGG